MQNLSFKTQFSLNVCIEVVGDRLIGPHVLQCHLTGNTYLQFLECHLPVRDVIPVPQRTETIFQHDVFPVHSSNSVWDFLTEQYPRLVVRAQFISHLDRQHVLEHKLLENADSLKVVRKQRKSWQLYMWRYSRLTTCASLKINTKNTR